MESLEWPLATLGIRAIVVRSVDPSICVISCSLTRHTTDSLANRSCPRKRLIKIIPISGKILFPNNNRIPSCCFRNPARIHCRLISQRLVKVILCSARSLICHGLIRKPATKGIPITNHVSIIRSSRFLARLNKLRGIVGRTLAILIKNKPMTFRCIYTKCNISCYVNNVIVLVSFAFSISCNIRTTFHYIPSFKMMCIILNGISHIDLITLFCRGGICTECHFLLAERDLVFIKISDPIILKQHRIVSHFCSVRGRRKHS